MKMTLDDLVGPHVLTGVDRDVPGIGDGIRFVLDGVTYIAHEDPKDGYRSCMGELEVNPEGPCVNMFAPVSVLAAMSDSSYDSILVLTDVLTQKTVLSVGTDGMDDYYPSFVANWHPENLVLNRESK